MMICEFVLVVFALVHTVSSNDYRWRNAIEFWSNVICSMEDVKTVNFHGVLEKSSSSSGNSNSSSSSSSSSSNSGGSGSGSGGDGGGGSIFLEQYFQAFVHDIARKCETTIISRMYTLRDSENLASFVSKNDVVRRAVKRPSFWKITSGDALPSRVMPSSSVAKRISKIRNEKTFGRNTWNVHVILTKDIPSFDQISKDDATFEWNSHDRFIVLIARFPEEYGPSNESNSKIDDILKRLWSEHKVQKIFVSEAMLINDTIQINPIVRTYNPFAKFNDSVWGQVEIIDVKTAEEASNVLSHLTYRRTKNMNGYELKVGYFKQGQTITEPIKVHSSTRYDYAYVFKGFDEMMLNTMAQDMNFQVEHVHPTDNKSYGYRLPNGTYVGAIGDVVHGRTDICFVSFFIKKYSTSTKEDVDFSVYVDFDRVCVAVPKATKIPKGIRIYHFFPPSVWICSMMTHVFTYLIWYSLQVLTPGSTGKRSFRATIYRSFLLNAGCPQKLPNTNAERILLSGILLANVTLVGIFGGILYNSFAHDMYYPDIDSLRALDASGLSISLTSVSLADLFDADNDDDIDSTLMQNLRKKMRFGINSVTTTARHRNISAFARESYFPVISEESIDADGGPLLHLVKECPGKFYLSYLLPKNSIFNEKINALISQLNQAGLPSLWRRHIIHGFIVQKRLLAKQKLARNEKETDGFVPFNLADMQSSFYMLLIGLLISTIVFLHEKSWLKVPLLHTEKPNCKSTR